MKKSHQPIAPNSSKLDVQAVIDAGGAIALADAAAKYVAQYEPEADPDATLMWIALRHTSNIVFYDLLTSIREHKTISPPTVVLLLILDMYAPMESRDLTRLFGMNPAAVSPHVEKLDQLEYISRRRSPRDRRTEIIELTEEGRQAFKEAFILYNQRAKLWTDNLTSSEKTELVRLLTKLIGTDEKSV